jgi:1-deoxy-D-xylulose-5-phosphate reductoisomerase
MVTRIALLGSTGSIGRQTLEVVRANADEFLIVGLAAGGNLDLLRHQIAEFGPALINSPSVGHLSQLVPGPGTSIRFVSLEEMAAAPQVDLAVIATAGKAGLLPTLAAIRAGKQVALANKEALVIAGELVMDAARAAGLEIRPVDSEHSAIWQCLRGEPHSAVKRLLLTASGGAFRDYQPDQLARVTPELALRHPTWQMGPKVTIDSATLMNKGLEIIEAHWLFGVDFDRIDVVLHRESIVHSMVEFVDGSIKAQLGTPDMRLPIHCALAYPRRLANPFPSLDLAAQGQLTFGPVDLRRYPCLRLARQAGAAGGTFPAVLSAADEEAVALFLGGNLPFTVIPDVVDAVLSAHVGIQHPDLATILSADAWARARAQESARRFTGG